MFIHGPVLSFKLIRMKDTEYYLFCYVSINQIICIHKDKTVRRPIHNKEVILTKAALPYSKKLFSIRKYRNLSETKNCAQSQKACYYSRKSFRD